ncbi:MAG: hypothetical protein LBQ83_05020 [Candidatus Margulisbacteria bacterium]|jgi:hypothetical protein|nr:hypothetical protein [Candidatus Margulisiibacteriota bacterium]
MTVQQIDNAPDEEQLWDTPKAAAPKPQAPEAKGAPRTDLPPPSIAHMASMDGGAFFADTPQDIARHKALQERNARLKVKSTELDRLVFGRLVDAADETQVLTAARHFYTLLTGGYSLEAALQFRQIAPELQEEIGYALLNTGEFAPGLRNAGLAGLFKSGARISPELKNLAAEKLAPSRSSPLSGALETIKARVASAYQAVGAARLFPERPEFLRLQKALYATGDTELIRQYEEACLYSLTAGQNIAAETARFRRGQSSPAELAAYLDSSVLVLETVYAAFSGLLREYQSPELTRLQESLRTQLDCVNQDAARVIRDIYQESQGRIVLKLSGAAYALLNEALTRLGEPPLSLLYCTLEELSAAEMLDLRFMEDSYEYTSQYQSQMSQAMELIVRIFRADAGEMARWKEEKLAELRKLEEFLEKVQTALRDFYKKLTDSQNLQKLENVQIVLNTYARGIKDIEEIINSKLTLNKTGALESTLAKYRLLYASERWQLIVNALCGPAA